MDTTTVDQQLTTRSELVNAIRERLGRTSLPRIQMLIVVTMTGLAFLHPQCSCTGTLMRCGCVTGSVLRWPMCPFLCCPAKRDTGQSQRVANFLLAWQNAEENGPWDPTDLWNVDTAVAEDKAHR